MSKISDIDNYISLYTQKINSESVKLEEEIENIFNDYSYKTCYIYYDIPASADKLIGMGETLNVSDFTFLIPNLFRICYAKKSSVIPYICPTYINPDNTVSYFPKLLNTNLIKSFLYFNFPGSIKNFNNNYDFIEKIYNFINYKKINMTYASYTSPIDIIFQIYSKNSILIELLGFSAYLTKSNYANNLNLTLNNFDIKWDFTKSCISYTTSETDIYTISNYTDSYTRLSQNDAYNLYNIQNSLLYLYKSTSTTTSNGLIILQNYSIYTVLDIVNQVFEDIIEEIKYYFQNKVYCKKEYMNTYNIPILLKIYKNYYNNQLYTIEKNLSTTTPYSITPSIISISTYVSDFTSIYSSSYSDRYLVKLLYLDSGNDALVIYYDLYNWFSVENGSTINYWYYYINVGYPSAVELYNINDSSTTYTELSDFTSSYNTSFLGSTLSISNSITYVDYGLWPDAGYTDDSSINNCGAVVYYITDTGSSTIQYILFETLESQTVMNDPGYDPGDSLTGGIGLVLKYYQNV
jgi:hypothetical protein